MFGRSVRLEPMIDSETVFNLIVKERKTSEKRLKIVPALKQSYDLGELGRLNWIPGEQNESEDLKKRF